MHILFYARALRCWIDVRGFGTANKEVERKSCQNFQHRTNLTQFEMRNVNMWYIMQYQRSLIPDEASLSSKEE